MSDGSYRRLCIAKALAECGYESDCFDNPDDQEMWDAGEEDRDYYLKRADAVLAVVGPELDRLRAEAERSENLRDERNTFVRIARERKERAEKAEAERDDLRARLAKVERALMQGGQTDRIRWRAAVEALASVPEPSDSEPDLADIVLPLMPKARRIVATFNLDNEPSYSEPAPEVKREAYLEGRGDKPGYGPWRCDRCGHRRWVGWAAGPGMPLRAQCVPCGHVQALPDREPAPDADREAGGR